MDYAQTVEFLYTQLPMFSKIGRAALMSIITEYYTAMGKRPVLSIIC